MFVCIEPLIIYHLVPGYHTNLTSYPEMLTEYTYVSYHNKLQYLQNVTVFQVKL